jgi:RNA polymerase sigma factor (sigma-70 family)
MRPTSASQAERALTVATRTAVGMLGPGHLAEDVAHDVVVRMLERKHQLRDPDKLDAWVYRIAAREAVRAARAQASRHRQEDDIASREIEGEAPRGLTAESIDRDSAARRALLLLNERERIVFVLKYVHDLTDRQIGQALGMRRGSVNSTLSRARTRLRADPQLQALAQVQDDAPTRNGDICEL